MKSHSTNSKPLAAAPLSVRAAALVARFSPGAGAAVIEAAQFAADKIRIYQERGTAGDRSDLNLAELRLRNALSDLRKV